jgi:pilus assembly protein Flp/PilA
VNLGEVKIEMLSLFINLQLMFARAMDEEEGQGLTEYALILALIAVIAIAALTLLGGKITSVLSTAANSI